MCSSSPAQNRLCHFFRHVNHHTFVFYHLPQHGDPLGRPSEVLCLVQTPFIEPHSWLFKSCLTFRFMTCLQEGAHHVLKEDRIFSIQIDSFRTEAHQLSYFVAQCLPTRAV